MNHKELDVWKESIELVKLVYQITKELPKEELFVLTAQIRKAAISVPSNIAEGAARKSDKEFLYFLNVARGSLAELDTQNEIIYQLYNLKIKSLDEKIITVGKLVSGLISYLENKTQ